MAFTSQAMPKIMVEHGRTLDGFAQVKVTNETIKPLACHVAIDGHKIRFKLQARQASQWYKANDKRYQHTDFSVWCDYLELHPKYNKQ